MDEELPHDRAGLDTRRLRDLIGAERFVAQQLLRNGNEGGQAQSEPSRVEGSLESRVDRPRFPVARRRTRSSVDRRDRVPAAARIPRRVLRTIVVPVTRFPLPDSSSRPDSFALANEAAPRFHQVGVLGSSPGAGGGAPDD